MAAEKFTTKIIVTELKQIHAGTTKNGKPYTIWQVRATKPDGTPIDMNLRSFSELPRNELLEVDAELFRSERYGDSYTISRKKNGGGGGNGGLAKSVDELRKRVDAIESHLGLGSPPPPPPAPAQPQPDVQTARSDLRQAAGLPGDDTPW